MSTAILESAPPISGVWRDDTENQRKTEKRTLAPDQMPTALAIEQESDFEIDYAVTSFPVEGEISVRVSDPENAPIRLRYSDSEGLLEVVGWDLTIPLGRAEELRRQIGRRFLELYSKAVTGNLRDEDRPSLRKISEQMDYHAFAASRKLPRYREATLVRKEPVLLVQFLEARNIKLNKTLTSKLSAIDVGERFAAWFTIDGNDEITDLNYVLRLPSLEEELSEQPPVASPIELPPGVRSLLPKPEQE